MRSAPGFACSGELLAFRLPSAFAHLRRSSAPFSLCNAPALGKLLYPDGRRVSPDFDGRIFFSIERGVGFGSRHRLSRVRKRKVVLLPRLALHESAGGARAAERASEDLARKELITLDAYFDKLQGKSPGSQEERPRLSNADRQGEEAVNSDAGDSYNAASVSPAATELRSLEEYLGKLSSQGSSNAEQSSADSEQDFESLVKEIAPNLQLSSFQDVLEASELESDTSTSTESNVVYIIVAINIAVYLFGLASPIDTAGVGTSTLPVLYGAKVNGLILDGEWWRLITPIFLHSGFLHLALGSWALLFFGPQVENVFGPLAFCMIYFLGGLCGNTFSFFFTAAPTVGGTGPLFSLLTAWVAYLWLNRKSIGEKSADYGIKATTFMGVLILGLTCLLPTDEWIHVGAMLPGLLFGAFSSPLLLVAMDVTDPEVKSMKNKEGKEGAYAMYDSPSSLSLTIVFIICTALCFGALLLYGPTATELQLLETIPF